jgi:hypothetical protein
MNNYTKEQYLVNPDILEQIDFESVEPKINSKLIFELKDLKDYSFEKIIFMTKHEYIEITSKIKPQKIWSYIKKIKTNVV